MRTKGPQRFEMERFRRLKRRNKNAVNHGQQPRLAKIWHWPPVVWSSLVSSRLAAFAGCWRSPRKDRCSPSNRAFFSILHSKARPLSSWLFPVAFSTGIEHRVRERRPHFSRGRLEHGSYRYAYSAFPWKRFKCNVPSFSRFYRTLLSSFFFPTPLPPSLSPMSIL